MESSSSNPVKEFDKFLDAPDEFYYDCLPLTRRDPLRQRSSLSAASLRRRKSANSIPSSDVERSQPSSSSSNGLSEVLVEKSDELKEDLGTSETPMNSDVIVSRMDVSIEKENDLVVNRVDPLQKGDTFTESTVTTVRDEDDYVESSAPPQLLQEPSNSTDWSLLGFLVGLIFKAIEFQLNLIISFVKYPSLLLNWCLLFVFDPFSMIKLGRSFITARFGLISDMVLASFKLGWLKDTKRMVNVACQFGWGLFWAVYVGLVLFSLLVMALMLGGFMINRVADKPFVIKEVLNFDYTKNSPEAFVPITSCAGVACDGSCKESNEMLKIRGVRAIPRDHKLEIALSMTLPESSYNKNLGMFQVRVDFLSADGQTLDSIRRPCMLRFRSEPIRLVQTFFKVVPLVTGYVSEIQTLSLKLKGFAEKDIPTACLKIMIEQRAEFRPGAGIPELYDASLSLESDLPFFKKVIWKWRKTLYVWISMILFITELLFALVCCRPLIIPRTRRRESPASNPTGSR